MDVIVEPGHALSREIAAGERADAQIDAFISKRDEKRRKDEEQQRVEDAWKASSRLHEATRRRENKAGWYSWHLARADLYAALSAEHAATAEGLLSGDNAA